MEEGGVLAGGGAGEGGALAGGGAGEGEGSIAGDRAVAQSLQAENCCCLPLCSQHTKDSMCMALGFFRGSI